MMLVNPFTQSAAAAAGQILASGTGDVVIPPGWGTISAVAIGWGGPAAFVYDSEIASGGGGGLAYLISLAVDPAGETLSAVVNTGETTLKRGAAVLLRATAGGILSAGEGTQGDVLFAGMPGHSSGWGDGQNRQGGNTALYTANATARAALGQSALGPGGGGTLYGFGQSISVSDDSAGLDPRGAGVLRVIYGEVAGVPRAYPGTYVGDV